MVSQTELHRRSSAHRQQSPATLRKRSCKCVSRITADSRPPLLAVCANAADRKNAFRCKRAFRSHGGLTNAAPCAPAFVHRKNRNCAGQRSRRNTRSGGCQPPVVWRTALAETIPPPLEDGRPTKQERGTNAALVRVRKCDRREDVFRCRNVSSRNPGGLTPTALGAGRSLDAEKATFAIHERAYSQERGA